jgi:XTP/dITP diphosphohydrolase
MKKILIATGNRGKLKEIREIFREMPFKLLGLEDLGIAADCEETGKTFEENAILKARFYAELINYEFPVLAEDSGVLVDALPGQLGVQTKYFGLGAGGSDLDWINYFLEVMRDVPENKRTARFVCCAVLLLPSGELKTFEAFTEGTITQTLEAEIHGGLPMSSCFRPLGYSQVYSALPSDVKHLVSHRGKAFAALAEYLF